MLEVGREKLPPAYRAGPVPSLPTTNLWIRVPVNEPPMIVQVVPSHLATTGPEPRPDSPAAYKAAPEPSSNTTIVWTMKIGGVPTDDQVLPSHRAIFGIGCPAKVVNPAPA
jgi:hypothetical protein